MNIDPINSSYIADEFPTQRASIASIAVVHIEPKNIDYACPMYAFGYWIAISTIENCVRPYSQHDWLDGISPARSPINQIHLVWFTFPCAPIHPVQRTLAPASIFGYYYSSSLNFCHNHCLRHLIYTIKVQTVFVRMSYVTFLIHYTKSFITHTVRYIKPNNFDNWIVIVPTHGFAKMIELDNVESYLHVRWFV